MGIGDLEQVQQRGDGSVFAPVAVQRVEYNVRLAASEFGKQLARVGEVVRRYFVAFAAERFGDAGAALEADFALSGKAAH